MNYLLAAFGCGDDLVEALITTQRIRARIETEIATFRASGERGSLRQFRVALARGRARPSTRKPASGS
jgi:hypothetical protein